MAEGEEGYVGGGGMVLWGGGGACSHGNCAVSTTVRVMLCPLSSASCGLSLPQLDMTVYAHTKNTRSSL